MVSKSRKAKEKQDLQTLYFADEASRNKAYQDIEERRLKEWENYQKSHRTPEDQRTNRAFIDISIDDAIAGRLVIDLYDTVVPRTVERFRSLVTGDMGVAKDTGTKIDYLHSKLQCIDKKKQLLCFGSFGMNIPFPIEDENFALRHTERGLLTMISHGPNTARTSFGITLSAAPCLDFRHVVFGKVVDGGAVLDRLEAAPVNAVGKPLIAPLIIFCGVLTGSVPPGVWEPCERTPDLSPAWVSVTEGDDLSQSVHIETVAEDTIVTCSSVVPSERSAVIDESMRDVMVNTGSPLRAERSPTSEIDSLPSPPHPPHSMILEEERDDQDHQSR